MKRSRCAWIDPVPATPAARRRFRMAQARRKALREAARLAVPDLHRIAPPKPGERTWALGPHGVKLRARRRHRLARWACSVCDERKRTANGLPACRGLARYWLRDPVWGRVQLCLYHAKPDLERSRAAAAKTAPPRKRPRR